MTTQDDDRRIRQLERMEEINNGKIAVLKTALESCIQMTIDMGKELQTQIVDKEMRIRELTAAVALLSGLNVGILERLDALALTA